MTSSGFLGCNGFTFNNADVDQFPYVRLLLGVFESTMGGKIKIECFHGTQVSLTSFPNVESSEIFAQCGGHSTSTKGTINGYYYRIGKNNIPMTVVFYPASTNLTGMTELKKLSWNVYVHYNISTPNFNYFVTTSKKSSWTNKCQAITHTYEINGVVANYYSTSSVHLYYNYLAPDTGVNNPNPFYSNTDIFYCPELFNVSNTGLITSAAGFNVSSSLKYKKNIQPLPDNYNLEMLMKYKPIVYEMLRSEDNKQYSGFIAEDMLDISANLFINFDNGNPDSLDYSRINVHLVKCLQELNTTVQQNKKEIEELKMILHKD